MISARSRLGGIVDSSELTPEPHRSALRLSLKRIHRKIAKGEEEIAEARVETYCRTFPLHENN